MMIPRSKWTALYLYHHAWTASPVDQGMDAAFCGAVVGGAVHRLDKVGQKKRLHELGLHLHRGTSLAGSTCTWINTFCFLMEKGTRMVPRQIDKLLIV